MRAEAPKRSFDAAGFKGGFPGLADPRLHYLDNAATAQMPEVVFDALRRFEVEARANVHEGMHARARAATDAYNQARARVARFLHANSDQEVVFAYGTTSSINLLAHSFGGACSPATRSCSRFSNITAIWCPGKGWPNGRASFCASCR